MPPPPPQHAPASAVVAASTIGAAGAGAVVAAAGGTWPAETKGGWPDELLPRPSYARDEMERDAKKLYKVYRHVQCRQCVTYSTHFVMTFLRAGSEGLASLSRIARWALACATLP